MKSKKLWGTLGGFGAGLLNGLLGAGGGMVVVMRTWLENSAKQK